MNSKDIEKIEEELGIQLPGFYLSTMLNYPFSEDSWAAEFSLCNNPKHVIELNEAIQPKGNIFAIGSDGGEFFYYIKLNGEEKVYIFDLEGSDKHMSIEADSWAKYLNQLNTLNIELYQEQLQELERKRNKKWWQFWV